AALEVDPFEDSLTVLLDQFRPTEPASHFDGQSAPVADAANDPPAAAAISNLTAHGMALILRNRDLVVGCSRMERVLAQQEAADNRERRGAFEERIAEKSSQFAPAGHCRFHVETPDHSLCKRNRKADPRIQEHIVVGKIRERAAIGGYVQP